MNIRDVIPKDWPVQPLRPADIESKWQVAKVCGSCGLAWDDSVPTSLTPAPSARCPFEAFHGYVTAEDVERVRDEDAALELADQALDAVDNLLADVDIPAELARRHVEDIVDRCQRALAELDEPGDEDPRTFGDIAQHADIVREEAQGSQNGEHRRLYALVERLAAQVSELAQRLAEGGAR